jgi:hypothetical protein
VTTTQRSLPAAFLLMTDEAPGKRMRRLAAVTLPPSAARHCRSILLCYAGHTVKFNASYLLQR